MPKRVFDIVASALGLALLSPLLVVIALWIKLDSRGPVLFRQERVGRHGVPFHIRKFRSMHVDAPRMGSALTIGRDPRITRAGHFLRASKLDELPQLIDVLLGRMSLVGPRPEVPRYVAMYPPALRDKVLSVRPGITDPASIASHGEAEQLGLAADPEREYVEVLMPAKLKLAAAYVEQATLWTDLRLIFRTLASIARRG